jgi:hypothetical protein
MALNGRTKIAIAVAGVAGAAALGMGGVALADPGGGQTELRIVTGHQEVQDGAGAGWTAQAPDKDCPEGSGGQGPGGAGSGGDAEQAAATR